MHLKSTWWGTGRKSGSEGGLVLKVMDYVKVKGSTLYRKVVTRLELDNYTDYEQSHDS